MPPFEIDFDFELILMAGKSYFGATTINCWNLVAVIASTKTEEEATATGAVHYSMPVTAASSRLTVPFVAVGSAIT
jgi:hypothetical protein